MSFSSLRRRARASFGFRSLAIGIAAVAGGRSLPSPTADAIAVNVDQAKLVKLPSPRCHHRGRKPADCRRNPADRRDDRRHRQGLRRHQFHRAWTAPARSWWTASSRSKAPPTSWSRSIAASIAKSYSCMPVCQRRVTLGDGENYFKSTIDQAGSLSAARPAAAPRRQARRTNRRHGGVRRRRTLAAGRRAGPCKSFRGCALNMVNARLTERVALSRSAETLQQSVSGRSSGQTRRCRLRISRCRHPPLQQPRPKGIAPVRRNRRGSAAVEFALVAPVFFALLFAIIETAIVFFAGQVLETITQNRARYIMTGTAQNAGRGVQPRRVSNLGMHPDPRAVQLRQHLCRRAELPGLHHREPSAVRSMPAEFRPPNNYSPGVSGEHRCREAVLSMAAVRHRTWLQHLEFGRQQAVAGRHRRVPERTLFRARR